MLQQKHQNVSISSVSYKLEAAKLILGNETKQI